MNSMVWIRWVVATILAMGMFGSPRASAQVPGRFYWKTLAGANAVPLVFESLSGNTNPFDPSHAVVPGANFSATLVLGGYARTFSLRDRAAMAAIILPMGRVSGDVTAPVLGFDLSSSGFGDPMVELNVNLIGMPAQKNIPDVLRYEPKFSVDVLADLALPIGEYDSGQPLNIGQNRWYGRVGAPVIVQLAPWVPGRRTTVELLPVVWLFGDNSDYVGQTLETDPMFQVDAHLTRDFTEGFWGALDAAWYTGGKASVNGVAGEALDNLGFGLTVGNQINENLSFTFGYKSTVNDSAPDALRMDNFMVTLVYGWHPLVEGMRRLKGEH